MTAGGGKLHALPTPHPCKVAHEWQTLTQGESTWELLALRAGGLRLRGQGGRVTRGPSKDRKPSVLAPASKGVPWVLGLHPLPWLQQPLQHRMHGLRSPHGLPSCARSFLLSAEPQGGGDS